MYDHVSVYLCIYVGMYIYKYKYLYMKKRTSLNM